MILIFLPYNLEGNKNRREKWKEYTDGLEYLAKRTKKKRIYRLAAFLL